MAKINRELLTILNDYELFMSSEKRTNLPFYVTQTKNNHPTSLYNTQSLTSEYEFGHVTIDCEMRDKSPYNYSFQILTDKVQSRVLARLDEGNGTHRNNIPTIPLAEQEVTTPHFHKYNSSGIFIAYKTNSLIHKSGRPLAIGEGIGLFCEEENISVDDNTTELIKVHPDGELPIEEDIDPLNGISF